MSAGTGRRRRGARKIAAGGRPALTAGIAADLLLRALWLGQRGEWEAAHTIVQAEDGAGAAWVHAWLHRIEGDAPNAAYWYRRAGKAAAEGGTDAEGEAIARALSTR